jgi:hypothetical protein
MNDHVSSAIRVINTILLRYHSFQIRQTEAQQFRRILRTCRHVLQDVLLQLNYDKLRDYTAAEEEETIFEEQIVILKAAVRTGGEVLGKYCAEKRSASQLHPRRLLRCLCSKIYIERLTKSSNKIHSVLYELLVSCGWDEDTPMKDGITEGVDEVKVEIDTLQQLVQDHNNEILDQLDQHSQHTEPLSSAILEELINIGAVLNRQDYLFQMKEIVKKAKELRNDHENLEINKALFYESILLTNHDLLHMVEQLSLNELNHVGSISSRHKELNEILNSLTELNSGCNSTPSAPVIPNIYEVTNDALQCPISFDQMQDPVTLFPSGFMFDKNKAVVRG